MVKLYLNHYTIKIALTVYSGSSSYQVEKDSKLVENSFYDCLYKSDLGEHQMVPPYLQFHITVELISCLAGLDSTAVFLHWNISTFWTKLKRKIVASSQGRWFIMRDRQFFSKIQRHRVRDTLSREHSLQGSSINVWHSLQFGDWFGWIQSNWRQAVQWSIPLQSMRVFSALSYKIIRTQLKTLLQVAAGHFIFCAISTSWLDGCAITKLIPTSWYY